MSVKLSLLFLTAFVAFQLLTIESNALNIVRRDAPATTEKTDSVQEAIDSFKSGIEDLTKKIQDNELFQNISQLANQFAEQVKKQGSEVINTLKTQTGNKPTN